MIYYVEINNYYTIVLLYFYVYVYFFLLLNRIVCDVRGHWTYYIKIHLKIKIYNYICALERIYIKIKDIYNDLLYILYFLQ